jgi:hypothetical protein
MINHCSISRARSAIANLRATVGGGETIPKATQDWGGANVIISNVSHGRRYREVVTSYALEALWMFEQMRDVFAKLIDGCTKFELYGRLELAANAAMQAQPDIGVTALGDALLVEAEAILGEMAAGDFASLRVTLGTSIARDLSEERTRHVGGRRTRSCSAT